MSCVIMKSYFICFIHCDSYMISSIIVNQSWKIMWSEKLKYLVLSSTCWSLKDTFMLLILMQWTRKLKIIERMSKIADNIFQCRKVTALLIELLVFLLTSDDISELTFIFRRSIKFSLKSHHQSSCNWWLQMRL